MCNSNRLIIILLLSCVAISSFAAPATKRLGIGQKASASQISGWDIDIRPDGKGLPAGQGSVSDGESLYDAKCASCHGSFGEGEGRWPPLAGGEGSLTEDRPEKTVGSYWPYASTLWDYINRAMPYPAPKSLSKEQVYAITAYVLYLNELVDEDFVLTQDNLATIKMPNEANFYRDNRPDTQNTRCMNNCKQASEMNIVQSLRGITPEQTSKPSPIANNNGEAIYLKNCIVCHGSGVAGAPIVGDTLEWQKRLQQGLPTVLKHAIEGYTGNSGVMPAKGGQPGLTDEQIKSAVNHMIGSQ